MSGSDRRVSDQRADEPVWIDGKPAGVHRVYEQLASIRSELLNGKLEKAAEIIIRLKADDAVLLLWRLRDGDHARGYWRATTHALRELAAEDKDVRRLLRREGLIPSREATRDMALDWIAGAYAALAWEDRHLGGIPFELESAATQLMQQFPNRRREVAVVALARHLHERPHSLREKLDGKAIRGRVRQAREEFIEENLFYRRAIHGEIDEAGARDRLGSLEWCPALPPVPTFEALDGLLLEISRNNLP